MSKQTKDKSGGSSDRWADQKFEALLERLEGIVKSLESGDKDLEESLAAFEEGVSLGRALNERLDLAEQRVSLLVRGANGELQAEPLNSDPTAESTGTESD